MTETQMAYFSFVLHAHCRFVRVVFHIVVTQDFRLSPSVSVITGEKGEKM